jgi:tRNA(Ile)-lysidine synthase
VPSLPEKLLAHIRKHELLTPGDRVGVAVSGGADSVALLRLLLELHEQLGVVLSVIHLNHNLRGTESDEDEEFVSALAHKYKLTFHSASADVAKHAAEHHLSLEAAARELRYACFERLINEALLDKVATGHTLDDQAETVLMRVIRGTGMRGLRGIQPRIEVGEVVRPLLWTRRKDLLCYLQSLGQSWREDSTNEQSKFTRNRVRQLLVPLLEREFNPSVTENLAELAEIARAEEDYWESEVEGWMGTVVQWSPPTSSMPSGFVPLSELSAGSSGHPEENSEDERMNAVVDRNWLLAEPLALQRRAIKAIGDHASIPLEYKHVEEVLQFAAQENGSGNQLMLPGGWTVVREGASLEFKAPRSDTPVESDYEYLLAVPGEVKIPQINLAISAVAMPVGSERQDVHPDQLFDPIQLSKQLVVRNWRPGDRFWPEHTKGHKKLKELLHEKHIPHGERRLWPVVVSGDEIVWVRGFAGRAHFRSKEGKGAILIVERALSDDDPES